MEKLRRGRQVVRYDQRGSGLSQREAVDYRPRWAQRDLGAVLSAIGGGPATLFTSGAFGPEGILYAASHPSRSNGLCSRGRRVCVRGVFA